MSSPFGSSDPGDEDVLDLTEDPGNASPANGSDHEDGDKRANCDDAQCIHQKLALRNQIYAKNQDLEQMRQANHVLQETNVALKGRVAALEQKLNGRGQYERTWDSQLRVYLETTGDNPRLGEYGEIYRLCCKEENMSSRPFYVHPNIFLVRPGLSRPCVQRYSKNNIRDPNEFHRFNDLPANVQAMIFRLWLFREHRLVHCLSRLDPYQPPRALAPSRTGLPNRFYWDKERLCNITQDTQDPQDILRLLLVCKSFYFKGAHAFYGLNTFAFSSLGEFCRFCNGIGPARAARLQHIELTWMGHQRLTMKPDQKGHWFSRRSAPLIHLQEMPRLLSMVIFINESERGYVRRKYEPIKWKVGEPKGPNEDETIKLQDYMAIKTGGQPIQRRSRNLRTVQGLDYIHALRGLRWIRFYDLWPALNFGGARDQVHDASLVADVNSTVTMPKSPSRAIEAELRNLIRLFDYVDKKEAEDEAKESGAPVPSDNKWTPSDVDWAVIETFYENISGDNAFNATRTYYGVRDRYSSEDSDSSDDTGADGDDEDDGNGDDEDDGDGDGDGDDSDANSRVEGNTGNHNNNNNNNGGDTNRNKKGGNEDDILDRFPFLRRRERDEFSRFPKSLLTALSNINDEGDGENSDSDEDVDSNDSASFIRRRGTMAALQQSLLAAESLNGGEVDSEDENLDGNSSPGVSDSDGASSMAGSSVPEWEGSDLFVRDYQPCSEASNSDMPSSDEDTTPPSRLSSGSINEVASESSISMPHEKPDPTGGDDEMGVNGGFGAPSSPTSPKRPSDEEPPAPKRHKAGSPNRTDSAGGSE